MMDVKLTYYAHSRRVPPTIKPERLGSHDLTVLISGSMTYIIGGATYTLNDNDIIFIPMGVKRERLAADTPCDYVSFNFISDTPDLPTVMERGRHSEIALLLSALDRIREKPALAFDERCEQTLLLLLGLLGDYHRAGRMHPLTLKILDYLNEHYRERITLEDIARMSYFSAVYCDRVFSREVGRSIVDYLIELRISEAQRLLFEGEQTVGDIALSLGFQDTNYFSRIFKSRTGYTPTEYRRSMRS